MTTEIIIIPCLKDNYAYIVHDRITNKNSLIDAPEAKPVISFFEKKGWTLDSILITHHHTDHIGGIDELVEVFKPKIYGALADKSRLPILDVKLSNNDQIKIGSLQFQILDVPGHTIGHIAYYCASQGIIFTGDSLMALGCGRLFEGTPKQMYSSLTKISQLPNDTLIYSGHEYAKNNAKFALSVEKENKYLDKRFNFIKENIRKNIPNVPETLIEEKRTNPFLRAHLPELKNSLNMVNSSDDQVFKLLRELKDAF
jgi:hydroxyacylglutathione hydrolase